MADIYATKNLQEFVYELGKVVLGVLKSKGRRAWELFLNTLGSLRGSISFDINGNPEWGLSKDCWIRTLLPTIWQRPLLLDVSFDINICLCTTSPTPLSDVRRTPAAHARCAAPMTSRRSGRR